MSIFRSVGLNGEKVHLSRSAVLLGSACVAGTVALYWYYRRCRNKIKDGNDPSSATTFGLDGLELSKKHKECGNQFFRRGEYQSALKAFNKAIETCPKEEVKHLAICYQNRAATYDRLGETQKSIDDCTVALRFDKVYLKAIVRRAKAHKLLKHYQEALDGKQHIYYARYVDANDSSNLANDLIDVINPLAALVLQEITDERGSTPIPVRDESVLVWHNCFTNDPILNDLDNPKLDSGLYGRALEAIRECRYEEVIPLLEQEMPQITEPTEILRDSVLLIRFAFMKEDQKISRALFCWVEHCSNIVVNVLSEFHHLTAEKLLRVHSPSELAAQRFCLNHGNKASSLSMRIVGTEVHKIGCQTKVYFIARDFDPAIQLDGGNVDIYIAAWLLYCEKLDTESAMKYLNRLEQTAPNHNFLKYAKADCQLANAIAQADVCATLRCIHDAYEILKDDSESQPIFYLLSGKLFYAAENRDLARESFEKAVEAFPQHSAPTTYLAMIEAENLDESSEKMRQLESKMKSRLEMEEGDPDVLAVLAKIAIKRNDYREAVGLYKQYLLLCPLRYHHSRAVPAIINYMQIKAMNEILKDLNDPQR
ncbi:unnamed protein product [Anisakis simplex]|uniref:Mitochondrial import receptor subunit TOM70 n=1 Tax=Anisakis simplex TaxID=6269 RepID=A0A0M3JSU0_ANISI|nr:unnamed protein product [Anisakis simplex]